MKKNLLILGLSAGIVLAGSAHAAVLFSTDFTNNTSTSNDGVAVAGTSRTIAWTGGGGNAASPAGVWTVPDSTKADLYGLPNGSFTFGGVSYGNGTTNLGVFKGSIFMSGNSTTTAFVDTINYSNNATHVIRSNTSAINDTSFAVLFEVKAGAGSLDGWDLSYRYGTFNSAWDNNTAAANGSTTASLYKMDGSNVMQLVGSFNSVNLAGAGPTANLSLSTSAQTAGIYLININMSGKTQTQRYSIDNLSLSAVPEPTTWALLAGGLTALVIFRRRRQA